MTKLAIGLIATVALAGPALAQSSTTTTTTTAGDQYYVVRDTSTKRCTVTTTRPASSGTTVVVGDVVYKSRTEADTAVTKVCTN